MKGYSIHTSKYIEYIKSDADNHPIYSYSVFRHGARVPKRYIYFNFESNEKIDNLRKKYESMEMTDSGRRQMYLIGVDYFHKFCYLSNSKDESVYLVEKKSDIKIIARAFNRCQFSAKSFMEGFTYDNPIFKDTYNDNVFNYTPTINFSKGVQDVSNQLVYTKSLYPYQTYSALIDLDNINNDQNIKIRNFLNINFRKKKCKNYKTLFNSLKDIYINELKKDDKFNSTLTKYQKFFDFELNCRTLKTWIGTIQSYNYHNISTPKYIDTDIMEASQICFDLYYKKILGDDRLVYIMLVDYLQYIKFNIRDRYKTYLNYKNANEDEKDKYLVDIFNMPKLEVNFATDGLIIALQNFFDFHDGYKPIFASFIRIDLFKDGMLQFYWNDEKIKVFKMESINVDVLEAKIEKILNMYNIDQLCNKIF